MKQVNTLFDMARPKPLAERMRPVTLEQFAGSSALDRSFIELLTDRKEGAKIQGRVPSVILWGPPGSGKTTLAKLMGQSFECDFVELSAVLAGVKDVREVVERARGAARPTLLFVDEIHRFNKSQQDAFLPHVEAGTISLVGATTENPSFYLTSALLSRCRLLVLPKLSAESLRGIAARAIAELGVESDETATAKLCEASQGDGRRLLNLIESIIDRMRRTSNDGRITEARVIEFLSDAGMTLYDRDGEEHYNIASALIKSLRGSNADAALYWAFRMLEGGEDPRFLIRRLVIFASEDVGNADPRALQVATATLDAYNLVGLPEGRIPIAQCVTYLATAPKSNRSYLSMHKAIAAVKEAPFAPVPLHLRNAPTQMMKSLGYGNDYLYPHNTEWGYSPGVRYLPDEVRGAPFYEPSQRGYEKNICERLNWLRTLDEQHGEKGDGE